MIRVVGMVAKGILNLEDLDLSSATSRVPLPAKRPYLTHGAGKGQLVVVGFAQFFDQLRTRDNDCPSRNSSDLEGTTLVLRCFA